MITGGVFACDEPELTFDEAPVADYKVLHEKMSFTSKQIQHVASCEIASVCKGLREQHLGELAYSIYEPSHSRPSSLALRCTWRKIHGEEVRRGECHTR
jgi:hypothetical protein